MSTRPNSPTHRATTSLTASARVRSAATATVRPPSSRRSSAAASSSAPASRAQIATAAPSRRSARALARPIPLLPPVTIATLPRNPKSIHSLRAGRKPAGRSALHRHFLGHHEDAVGEVEELVFVGPNHFEVSRLGESLLHFIKVVGP